MLRIIFDFVEKEMSFSLSIMFYFTISDRMSSINSDCTAFKVCLIGSSKVGKSVYLQRYRTGEFREKYLATLGGVEVYPVNFSTNKGKIILYVWDCAGQREFEELSSGYWIQADAAMIMFDLTSNDTFMHAQSIHDNFRALHPSVPLVVCGNKSDCVVKDVGQNNICVWKQEKGFDYYNISARSNYNFEKPWLSLLRSLTGDESLEIIH